MKCHDTTNLGAFDLSTYLNSFKVHISQSEFISNDMRGLIAIIKVEISFDHIGTPSFMWTIVFVLRSTPKHTPSNIGTLTLYLFNFLGNENMLDS